MWESFPKQCSPSTEEAWRVDKGSLCTIEEESKGGRSPEHAQSGRTFPGVLIFKSGVEEEKLSEQTGSSTCWAQGH